MICACACENAVRRMTDRLHINTYIISLTLSKLAYHSLRITVLHFTASIVLHAGPALRNIGGGGNRSNYADLFPIKVNKQKKNIIIIVLIADWT